MGSITETDLPENFSFSCYELDSSIFNEDVDKESFIEINLEETRDSREFEFRISISSVPVSQFCSQGLRDDELRHEGQASSASDGKTQIPSTGRAEADGSMWISTAEIPRRREVAKQKFPAAQRKLKFRGKVNGHPEFTCRDWKPSKLVTAFNSSIMKLSMKLRSGNIRTAFMSFIKSYNTFSHQSSRQRSGRITQEIRIYGRLTDPFHRWWPQINNTIAKRRGNNIKNNDGNLSIKLKELQVESSSSSLNSSPIRRDPFNQRTSCAERENSVRAAIDHCKRSPLDALDYLPSYNNVCD